MEDTSGHEGFFIKEFDLSPYREGPNGISRMFFLLGLLSTSVVDKASELALTSVFVTAYKT